MQISWEDFERVDVRVGEIVGVDDFPEAKIPAYKLMIDFGGDIGTKRSSGRFPALYAKGDMLGKQVVAVVNFPPKLIGPFESEVLVLGVPDEAGNAVLLRPTKPVPKGGKMF